MLYQWQWTEFLCLNLTDNIFPLQSKSYFTERERGRETNKKERKNRNWLKTYIYAQQKQFLAASIQGYLNTNPV